MMSFTDFTLKTLLPPARDILLANFAALQSKTLTADWKRDDKEAVTKGEQAAEAAMVALVQQHYPDHNTLGEEHGFQSIHDNAEYCWVFDPIDGTSAMLAAADGATGGGFGLTMGLVKNGKPILGLVHDLLNNITHIGTPNTQPTIITETASSPALPMVPAAASAIAIDKNITITCTVPALMFKTPTQQAAWEGLCTAGVQIVENRNCLGFMDLLTSELAKPSVDAVWEGDLAYHDVAPLVPILQGAGLKVTGEAGQPLDFSASQYDKEFRVVVANAALHKKLLPFTAQAVSGLDEPPSSNAHTNAKF